MELLVILFAIGIIALALLWLYDAYKSYKLVKQMEDWEILVGHFIQTFEEAKGVINVNAGTLRSLQGVAARHEKMLEVITTVVDIQSHALKINPDLRMRLESTVIDDLPIEQLEENDDNEEE